MERKWIIVAAALAAWPAGLTAPGDSPPAASATRAARPAFVMSDHRGRIAWWFKTDASPETDKIGAKIEGVTPGGPADKAGLKVGDVIIKFNGTSLTAVKTEDEDESGPGREAGRSSPAGSNPTTTVQVEYRRGNDTKQTDAHRRGSGLDVPDGDARAARDRHGSDARHGSLRALRVAVGRPRAREPQRRPGRLLRHEGRRSRREGTGGLESAPEGRRRDHVDRRAQPANPSHAMRISARTRRAKRCRSRSCASRKRMTLAWKVPAREDRIFRMHQNREEHEDQSGAHRLHLQLHRLTRLQRV